MNCFSICYHQSIEIYNLIIFLPVITLICLLESQYSLRPSSTKLRCFSLSVINIELYRTTISNSVRDNLRPVSSLLGSSGRHSRERPLLRSKSSGLSAYALKLPFVGKDETGRRLSRKLLLIVVR